MSTANCIEPFNHLRENTLALVIVTYVEDAGQARRKVIWECAAYNTQNTFQLPVIRVQ